MKTFKNQAAQGDLLLNRVDGLPKGAKEIKPESHNGSQVHVVAHSETGHPHYVAASEARFYGTDDPMVCYLQVDGEYADLVHDKPDVNSQHETIRVPQGTFIMRRQREHTPEGWRMVQD